MILSDKPIAKLIEADLQVLIDEQIAEAKTLDYKLMGYGNSDDHKREFLKDVTNFFSQTPPAAISLLGWMKMTGRRLLFQE